MTITLDIWRVHRWAIPIAVVFMALHRRVRRLPECTFAKLLGTGTGRTFTPRDADARQWAILSVWSTPEPPPTFDRFLRAWNRISSEHAHFALAPLSSHGTWSGRHPFGHPQPRRTDRAVVAITRARIAWRKNPIFWGAVPPVTAALHTAPGLLQAIGIGEAPLGLQGTFSLWESDQALQAFAYRGAEHRVAIEQTAAERWYVEELFARFEVCSAAGQLRGRTLHIPAP